MKTIKMKKILIALLSCILVISGVLVYRKLNRPASKPTASASAGSTETAAAPLVSADSLIVPLYSKVSYAPITPDNTTGFSSGWSPATTDGNISGNFTYEDKVLTISSPGSNLQAASLYRDGIPLTAGTSYTLYFTASCSGSRKIRAEVLNADTGASFGYQDYSISPTAASEQLSFKMTAANTYNARIIFYLGQDGSADTQSEHTITLTGIRLVPSEWMFGVKTNQIGYEIGSQKRCTFSYDAGDVFDVVDTATGTVVYSGAILAKAKDESTGETECYGDFTNVTTPGTYQIRSQIGVSSNNFTIGDNLFDSMDSALLKMLSLQRCGQNLDSSWAGSLAHAQCHTEQATIYGTENKIDVTGGWHDAGDYGRYIKTGAKAVSDLLFAYMYNPNTFTDSTGSENSNNGVADILDEARYELEWMLKMQDTDGGVYNKVLTTSLAGIVTPDQDTQPLYVLEKETTSTGDFGGTMATAAIAFQKVDPDFSATCLKAAKAAYQYLNNNPDLYDAKNPSDVSGGEYIDSDDRDSRFYTDLALWSATKEDEYLNAAKTLYAADHNAAMGLSWSTNGGYGRYLFLTQQDAKKADSDFYQAMMSSLKSEAQNILNTVNANSYNTSIYDYVWGSNGIISDNGVLMSMVYDLTGDQAYLQGAVEQLNYLLGKNSLNMSFVSGYGIAYPTDVHSRVAKAKNTSFPGALVGGPNASREDPVTQAMSDSVPQAKVYSDSFESYSTNEIAIYWNSSLIHLLAKLH